MEEVRFGFAKAVRDRRRERARISYLEQAKDYIATHLNKEFTLESMAKEIGVNPSYLSRKFKEYENMGIAQYLCFHSQSYFGAVFKEYTGLSPRRYREQEKVTDFFPHYTA